MTSTKAEIDIGGNVCSIQCIAESQCVVMPTCLSSETHKFTFLNQEKRETPQFDTSPIRLRLFPKRSSCSSSSSSFTYASPPAARKVASMENLPVIRRNISTTSSSCFESNADDDDIFPFILAAPSELFSSPSKPGSHPIVGLDKHERSNGRFVLRPRTKLRRKHVNKKAVVSKSSPTLSSSSIASALVAGSAFTNTPTNLLLRLNLDAGPIEAQVPQNNNIVPGLTMTKKLEPTSGPHGFFPLRRRKLERGSQLSASDAPNLPLLHRRRKQRRQSYQEEVFGRSDPCISHGSPPLPLFPTVF